MVEKTMSKDVLNSAEAFNIKIKEAGPADLRPLEDFLSRHEIDSLFTPALSDPARGITIRERVEKKAKTGVWIIAEYEGKVIGCMAIVPCKLSTEVPPPTTKVPNAISEGVSFDGWDVEKIMELSTVVTDQDLLKNVLKVKGVGASLLHQVKAWVKSHGNGKWGLITDSWVGGDMGGFVQNMNNKAYRSQMNPKEEIPGVPPEAPNTLVRMYTDPEKRGEHGPATVVYGIPIEKRDWEFFNSQKIGIENLNSHYNALLFPNS